jgi:hypothetical protein
MEDACQRRVSIALAMLYEYRHDVVGEGVTLQ